HILRRRKIERRHPLLWFLRRRFAGGRFLRTRVGLKFGLVLALHLLRILIVERKQVRRGFVDLRFFLLGGFFFGGLRFLRIRRRLYLSRRLGRRRLGRLRLLFGLRLRRRLRDNGRRRGRIVRRYGNRASALEISFRHQRHADGLIVARRITEMGGLAPDGANQKRSVEHDRARQRNPEVAFAGARRAPAYGTRGRKISCFPHPLCAHTAARSERQSFTTVGAFWTRNDKSSAEKSRSVRVYRPFMRFEVAVME